VHDSTQVDGSLSSLQAGPFDIWVALPTSPADYHDSAEHPNLQRRSKTSLKHNPEWAQLVPEELVDVLKQKLRSNVIKPFKQRQETRTYARQNKSPWTKQTIEVETRRSERTQQELD